MGTVWHDVDPFLYVGIVVPFLKSFGTYTHNPSYKSILLNSLSNNELSQGDT